MQCPNSEQIIGCPNCGKRISLKQKFCKNCGSKL